MSLVRTGRITLKGASAALLALAAQPVASAQDVVQNGDSEFLGTLTLGESKREVQTHTATPVTAIDREEIEDRQAGTVAELIDSVPGVNLINGSTPVGSGIQIRGFGAWTGIYGSDQKVAVQVDGASVGSEELYRIGTQLYTDPALYKSVEVIRGTVGSFEYGSGIIGGVVRLETIDPSDMTAGEPGLVFRQTLGVASNSNGVNSSSTLAYQANDYFEVLGNFSWREQSEQEDGNGERIDNSRFELPSYLLKARLHGGDHDLSVSYTNSETSDQDVPYDTFAPVAGSDFSNVDRDTKSETISLDYNFNPISDLIDVDALLSYANQEIDQAPVVPGGSPLYDADHQYETTKLTVKNTALIDTGALSHDIRAGLEFIRKERTTASSASGGTDNRHALFLIDQIRLDGWTFSPALRYEASEVDGDDEFGYAGNEGAEYENDTFMGGASLRYQFESGWAAFGSVARTENLPVLDDLSGSNAPVYMNQPEVSDTYEIGGSYERTDVLSPDDTLAFKVNYYTTRLTDITSYSGVSEVELSGLEVEGAYARPDGLYFDVNANIISGDEISSTGAEGDWRNLPNNSLRLTVGKRFTNLFDFSGELVAADKRSIEALSSFYSKDANGYVLFNLRANVTPQSGVLEGTSIRFGVENVLDQAYTPAQATRPAPGRNIKVTVAQTF